MSLAVSPRRGLAGQTDNSWVKVEKLSVPWAGPCHPPPSLLHSTEILPTVSVSGAAGGQPWDMPTHGSLAAARQANARARPRARVSGPAHRPRPAQPSAPAPARDTALTPQSPESYPHTSSTMHPGTGIFLCRSSASTAPRDLCKCQSGPVPGLAPKGAPGPCICCPPPQCPVGFKVARPPPCPHT